MTDPRLERPLWRGRTNVDAFTIACLERAEQIGGHQHIVTQGSYQGGSGDPNSAGTHDLGGVIDLAWCGHNACVLALRQAGTFAWHRTPDQGPWPHHIHLGVLGHPFMAEGARRQEVAYRNRLNGLSDNGPDDGPRLNPIPDPVFPWPEEFRVTEDDAKRIRAIVREEIDATLIPNPGNPKGDPWKLSRILVAIWQRAGR